MGNTTDSAGLSVEGREHYDKTLLYVARPTMLHRKWAAHKTIPAGSGKSTNWRRYTRFAPATTPLTEGTPPAGANMNAVGVRVTVEQYGMWVPMSDRLPVQSITDNLANENAKLLGINMGETLDIIARDAFNQGSNVVYPSGISSRANITSANKITELDIRRIVKVLSKANCRRINGKYIGLVSPDVYMDLQGLAAYLNIGYHQRASAIEDGEVMPLFGVDWYETTQAKIYAGAGSGGIDVHSVLVFGADAIADADIERLKPQMIFKALGSAGTADPLNQMSTQGWKASYAAKILNDAFIVRFECAVS